MHWIEQLFGIDADGGSGALEALIAAASALAVALAGICSARWLRTRHSGRR